MASKSIPAGFKNEAFVLHDIDDARVQPYELPPKPGPNGIITTKAYNKLQ